MYLVGPRALKALRQFRQASELSRQVSEKAPTMTAPTQPFATCSATARPLPCTRVPARPGTRRPSPCRPPSELVAAVPSPHTATTALLAQPVASLSTEPSCCTELARTPPLLLNHVPGSTFAHSLPHSSPEAPPIRRASPRHSRSPFVQPTAPFSN